jgi:hypothetical protein
MKMPVQAKPVERRPSVARSNESKGVFQSDSCCGPAACCVGACAFGNCLGVCIPNVGQC